MPNKSPQPSESGSTPEGASVGLSEEPANSAPLSAEHGAPALTKPSCESNGDEPDARPSASSPLPEEPVSLFVEPGTSPMDEPRDGPSGVVAPARDPRQLIQGQRIEVPIVEIEFDASPVEKKDIPAHLREDVWGAERTRRLAGTVKAQYRDPESLVVATTHLYRIADPATRLQSAHDVLAFVEKLEQAGMPATELFPDSLWMDPQHPRNVVLLAGPLTGRGWATEAAAFLVTAWLSGTGVVEERVPSDALAPWTDALLTVNPPIPPRLVGLLRDCLLDGGKVADMRAAWQRLSTFEPRAPGTAVDVQFRYGVAQVVGRAKASDRQPPAEQQEDKYWIGPVDVSGSRIAVIAVADGVSTRDYGSGSAAAEDAICGVEDTYENLSKLKLVVDGRSFLKEVMDASASFVAGYVHNLREHYGEGTPPASTFSAAAIAEDGRVDVCWVGDTPILQWNSIRQTFDSLCCPHTAGMEAVIRSEETALSVETTSERSSLTRCFGGDKPEADFLSTWLAPGEGIVIASDGLLAGFGARHGPARRATSIRELANRFMEIYRSTGNLSTTCEELCSESDRSSGRDNITIAAVWRGVPAFGAPTTAPEAKRSPSPPVRAEPSRHAELRDELPYNPNKRRK